MAKIGIYIEIDLKHPISIDIIATKEIAGDKLDTDDKEHFKQQIEEFNDEINEIYRKKKDDDTK